MKLFDQKSNGCPSSITMLQGSKQTRLNTRTLNVSRFQIFLGLREGSWVDLHSKRRWLRAQLIWASARGTLFMFVSHGGQPHSMTKRICERLITQGLMRPINTSGVVDHALDALLAQSETPLPDLT